ncbi:uroporphyrinogen-III synthase HEM4 [Sporobolomyces koalae]|uniref:uroporphyrinogen-III synthase HEM4 n=1 Tax=Sporobolomyces koalae TaxID=500713 RepID=UPI00316D897E
MSRARLLLLKALSSTSCGSNDSLLEISYLPILETTISPNLVSARLSSNSTETLDGIVLSSQRAVETLRLALAQQETYPWSRIPHFVVGPHTRAQLLETLEPFSKGSDGDEVVIEGHESRTGADLARHVIDYFNRRPRPKDPPRPPRKLLWLSGTRTNDALPTSLERHEFELEQVQVYDTTLSPTFSQTLIKHLEACDPVDRVWIGVCSPVGAGYLIDTLRNHGMDPTRLDQIKFVAIGTTTRDALESHGVTVDAVAQVPGEQGIVKAVLLAEKET